MGDFYTDAIAGLPLGLFVGGFSIQYFGSEAYLPIMLASILLSGIIFTKIFYRSKMRRRASVTDANERRRVPWLRYTTAQNPGDAEAQEGA